MVLLGLVFAVQNPLLPAAALIFFAVSGSICRYNWLYIHAQGFQGGGMVSAAAPPRAFAASPSLPACTCIATGTVGQCVSMDMRSAIGLWVENLSHKTLQPSPKLD